MDDHKAIEKKHSSWSLVQSEQQETSQKIAEHNEETIRKRGTIHKKLKWYDDINKVLFCIKITGVNVFFLVRRINISQWYCLTSC